MSKIFPRHREAAKRQVRTPPRPLPLLGGLAGTLDVALRLGSGQPSASGQAVAVLQPGPSPKQRWGPEQQSWPYRPLTKARG